MSQNSQQVTSSDTVKMVVKSNQAANGNVHHIATIGMYTYFSIALPNVDDSIMTFFFFFELLARGDNDVARLGAGATSNIVVHFAINYAEVP